MNSLCIFSVELSKCFFSSWYISSKLLSGYGNRFESILLIVYIWVTDSEVEFLKCIDDDKVVYGLPVVLIWNTSWEPVFDHNLWRRSFHFDCLRDSPISISNNSIRRYSEPFEAFNKSNFFHRDSFVSVEFFDDCLDEMSSLHNPRSVCLLEWGDLFRNQLFNEIFSSSWFRTHHTRESCTTDTSCSCFEPFFRSLCAVDYWVVHTSCMLGSMISAGVSCGTSFISFVTPRRRSDAVVSVGLFACSRSLFCFPSSVPTISSSV